MLRGPKAVVKAQVGRDGKFWRTFGGGSTGLPSYRPFFGPNPPAIYICPKATGKIVNTFSRGGKADKLARIVKNWQWASRFF